MESECKECIKLDDAISRIGTGKAQYLMLILTAGGYLATCSELLLFVFSTDPIASLWSIDNETFSWLPFATSLAGIFGSLTFGIWSDQRGRQIPFIISIGLSAIFSVASAFSPNFTTFVLLRSFVSFGIGGIVSVDFVILSEFLPRQNRGRFMVMITLSGSLGVAYTAGMAWFLVANNHWHLFVIVCAIPLLLIFLIRLLVNFESPQFLLSKGKYEEAVKILSRIAVLNNRADVLNGVEIIKQQEEKPHNILDLFSKDFAIQTLQMTAIWMLQATGYWGVTIFFPKYLTRFGIAQYFSMFINVCANIPGFFLITIMIDRPRFGRLRTLRAFIFGTMMSLLLLTFLQDEISISVLAVVTYFFMPPIYAILQIYTTEIYPTLLRSTAMSWTTIVVSIPNMTTAFIGAELVSSSKKWLYPLVWASVFLLQLAIALTLKKETTAVALRAAEEDELKCKENETDFIQT